MINDITLGQYFPGDSVIHRADPRMKLIIAFIMIGAIFTASSIISFVLLAIVVILFTVISKISLSVVLKGMKPVLFILLFTAVIQVFLTRTGTLVAEWWIFRIYSDGFIMAFKMMCRIALLVASTSLLLSYTTSPIALTDGIEGLLSPLKKLGLNTHDFAMMMSIAMRFIPTIIEETDKIMSAQKARGTDFSSGGLIKRAKAMIPIFIPLLASEIRRADELSCAMICRCYRGGEGRTKLKELKITSNDVILLLTCIGILALVIAANIFTKHFGLPI